MEDIKSNSKNSAKGGNFLIFKTMLDKKRTINMKNLINNAFTGVKDCNKVRKAKVLTFSLNLLGASISKDYLFIFSCSHKFKSN